MNVVNTYEPKRAWLMTGLLALFMLVNFVDKVALGILAVPIMEEFNLSPKEFGWVAGSFFWFFAISGVIGGFVANRFSSKVILVVLALAWSVVQLPIIFSSSVMMILVARVLLGIGEGPAAPIAKHALFKWFPDSRRTMPIAVIGQGSVFGLLIAGVAMPHITAQWGWRANFVILFFLGLVWAVLWLVFGADGKLKTETHVADGQTTSYKIHYKKLLMTPTVWGNFLMDFAAFWSMVLVLVWLPTYLQKGLGYDAKMSGNFFALIVLFSVPMTLFLSSWSQRLTVRGVSSRNARAIFGSLALFFAGVLFILLNYVPMPKMAKVFLIAFATGLTPVIYALGPSMIAEVTPDGQRSAILAIDNSFSSLAGIFASVITGAFIGSANLGSSVGYEKGFAFGGVLLVLAGLVGLLFINPERDRQNLIKHRR